MVRLLGTYVIVGFVGLGVVGCGPPSPPGRVNAVLAQRMPPHWELQEACDRADTVVLAQCTQRQEYAKTVKGDWERHWHVTRWQVVRVERGQWPNASVDFIFCESWPTPESGIMLEAAPPVYYRGAMLAFCIDTSQPKPTIVAQEPRSRIPPHGELRRPPRDFYDLGENSTHNRVMDAVMRFAGGDRSLFPRTVLEEYDDFYVVEVGNALERETVTVDKDDYEVRPVAPAYK